MVMESAVGREVEKRKKYRLVMRRTSPSVSEDVSVCMRNDSAAAHTKSVSELAHTSRSLDDTETLYVPYAPPPPAPKGALTQVQRHYSVALPSSAPRAKRPRKCGREKGS
ncbi:hypothetical protein SKAU_G00146670 [Synaphobranchus kaupii]|uniref:Uncharacterized protein n=1 Tax=Synaphobranchus kaupii TaxID=118154 RepID=A0A9Q1FU02_SYNKA|nr:hypothetical protein SKAU_G00146670 [Synaphobranchus kaupii]